MLGATHRPGLRFAGRHVLRAGIVLVGLRLSLGEIAELGPRSLAAVVAVVAATFLGTRWLARRLGLSPSLGLLVATGYSICGASAIAAVEPLADSTEEEVAYSVALVTLCGTLSIGVLPVLGHLLGLGDAGFGSWVGAAVHDIGQVVAAASTRNDAALHAAVVVKLTRVALLAPLLTLVALRRRRRPGTAAAGRARVPLLPAFLVGFLVAVGVRSSGWLSTASLERLQLVETLLLGAGLVGLGSAVDLGRLRRVGGRPLVLGLASWALVAVAALAATAVAV